jgi:arylsulfatase A-like enzyme
MTKPGIETRPNILFIMTDQQHARMLSCAGDRWLNTPAMDCLARDGIRFEKAYCTNPVCVPSRISMATGVMSCRLGADDNDLGSKVAELPREVDENSMGRLMRRAGYETFYGGKVHLCPPLEPRDAGYDEYVADERDYLPEACVEFMRKERDRPFFALASFINPHDICYAHMARVRGYDPFGVCGLHRTAAALPDDKLPPLPGNYAIPEGEPSAALEAALNPNAATPAIPMRNTYDERAWRINRWIYRRLTEQVDRQIGRLLDGLKAAGLEKNTLIVFTSDHGNMDGSHRLSSKSLFYEESVGVPLILKLPGRIPAGRTDHEHLVSTGLDLLPTLCDYAGIASPSHLLGKSLRGLAEGGREDDWRPFVVAENEWFRMVRSQRYKYCAFRQCDGGEWLVDLERDPGESRNIAGEAEARAALAEHRSLLAEWSRFSNDSKAALFGVVSSDDGVIA